MRRLLPVVTACLLLVAVGLTARAGAVTPYPEYPVYVPSPPATFTIGCGQSQTLVSVDYWDNPTFPDTFRYMARFRASGGPATITFVVEGEGGGSDTLQLPANSSEQSYRLETSKGLTEDYPTHSYLQVTTPACSSTIKGAITIHSVNIHEAP